MLWREDLTSLVELNCVRERDRNCEFRASGAANVPTYIVIYATLDIFMCSRMRKAQLGLTLPIHEYISYRNHYCTVGEHRCWRVRAKGNAARDRVF
jgi:hypothetical protein